MTTVLITRPLSSALSLAEKIKTRLSHVQPIIFPCIAIEDVDENPFIALPQALSTIDIIIFISPTAVEKTATYLSQLPSSIKLFAVGKATAQKIHQCGWGQAYFPHKKFNSEALLNLSALNSIQGQSILICKGEGGNTLLSNSLSLRGAIVREAVVYKRCLPKVISYPDLNTIDVILCTSSETLHNLITLLGNAVKEKRLLVSSEKLKIQAKITGFKLPAFVANNAGEEALISAIASLM